MPIEINPIKTAVIGFSDAASPLEPTWPSTHRALLPIAGKAVIVHLIEQLSAAGIRHLRIAGSIQQFAVRARLGTGQEWGTTVRYSDLYGADLFAQTLIERGNCLYLLGDQMLAVKHALTGLHATRPAAMIPGKCNFPAYWQLSADGPLCWKLADNIFGSVARLKTTEDFHTTNLLAADGTGIGINLPGYLLGSKIHVGWDTYIHPDAEIEDGVTIGAQCYIGSRVSLKAPCVIGDGSVIDSGVILQNTSVLPNCFVGSRTRLRDSIITPRAVFDLHGNFWQVRDPSIIGRSRSNQESKTGLPEESLSEIERRLVNAALSGTPWRKLNLFKSSSKG
jgi:NDP-sugar pyrophosphorylase family protein